MLYVDHYHTNPVLVSFCHILITGHRERQLQKAIKYWYLNQSAGSASRLNRTGFKEREMNTQRLPGVPEMLQVPPSPAPLSLHSMSWVSFHQGAWEA